MKLLVGIIGILVGIIGTASFADRSPSSHYAVSDSLIIELQPQFDSLGLLEIYSGRVSTPVCEGSKCYTVEITFYWDLIGSPGFTTLIPSRERIDQIGSHSFYFYRLRKTESYIEKSNIIALCLQQGGACKGEPQLSHRWDNWRHQN